MPSAVLDPAISAPSKPKVGFVSLGCPKNLVDSEVMMGLLHHNGAELTPRAEDAEIIVINTCSFIDSAKQESVNTILEMVQHKQKNGGKAQRIIVAGCLVERYRDEIQKNIPEVDAVVGTGELEAILAAAGLTPTSNSPFNILPQDFNQPSIESHTQTDRALLEGNLVNETTVTQQLVHRAPSAVNQHSRPEVEGHIAPQLRIVQSLAETGTTHGDEPLAHTGDHIQRGIDPGNTSRPEGDLRQQQGRFSRESWDGATAALPEYLYNDATPRILTTPRASAYIKIAEGCDHPCSFCIIPQLRGKFRSRRMGSIIAEAQNLIAQGVREITLIGQDTTCYGEDLGLKEGLAQLLDGLAVLPGLRWLRFLYTYPNKVTTRLLETMARHDTISKYLDVPLQHASPNVLKTMKRGGNAQIFLNLIAKARQIVPGIVIRTSFIVGFPGETEADYKLLEDFVKAARIDWLGVFTYSDEEGAKAFELPDDTKVPNRTIQARRRKLMKLQQKISTTEKLKWVGREIDLLVEGPSEETDLLWEGRTSLHAPEIDGKVFINDFGPHEELVPGTFYRAEITESHDYDVVARILE
ncbi:30S ribosomal protein S12 methylthiotransferase RimO [Granulicella tundricola]|uniref:Ribosomal protein uS12 methylthiotransferase RimO n=1 Tax=Granulicella tundricola (strain ATCC BAA-1859 / DSM 23138 / MP5ACTX9) TaxID=1198114 RepID=E8X2W8_GRATM|nr:30S ribosomal protein S12 methylthiotransferase RimO [Granulicella tundricola]ADW68102.1 MiaB-like tRNA modifying enzyme YliG [Granulicella tundricola MP5ACTX9]